MKSLKFFSLAACLFVLGMSACKKEVDAPPVEDYPTLTATHTIAELKRDYAPTTGPSPIDSGVIIEGIVVGDDKTGNFYKNLVIQDSTGGMQIRINVTNLYNNYPRNRKVWLRCDGLFLDDFNGTPQITAQAGAGIEDALLRKHLVPGPYNQVVEPTLVTIQNIGPEHINTLVRLENVEFASADAGEYYADPFGNRTVNRTIRDCNGGSILLRTSGYSELASAFTPAGSGSIMAVYAVFGSDKQLYIRDTTDVNMTGQRCTGGGGGGGTVTSIADIRAIFPASQSIADGTRLRGFVISDNSTGNSDNRNLVVQDATAGITIRFTSNHNFSLGDEVEFDLSGGTLSEFSGLLQVGSVPAGAGDVVSSGNSFTPPTVTVSQVVANLNSTRTMESTLVRIENATITGGATYAGGRTVADGSGDNITLFTRNQASFSGDPIPSGTVELTAIVSVFNTPQISIRNLSDVVGGGPAPTPDATDISDIRAQFTAGNTNVSGNRTIKGIVTSDYTTASVVGQNMFIQDGTAGIVVRFTASHSFALGDEVEILVSGATLEEFQGLLQISGVALASANRMSQGNTVTPVTLTISALLANFESYEAQLVRIDNVTFSDGPDFNFAQTITDATGSMDVFTRTQATFAGTPIPTGQKTIIGLASQGGNQSSQQVVMRSLGDITP